MKREMSPGGPTRDPRKEVQEEIEFYLEERTREFEASGMEPEEARQAAARAFGDKQRIEAEVGRIRRGRRRDEGRSMIMSSLAQDLRLSFRGIKSRPGFTAVIVATLALGIGAVTAIFSVVNASLLTALPFEDAQRLVFLQGAYDAPEGPAIRGASILEARDWAEMSTSFTRMAPLSTTSANLTGDGPAVRLQAEQVGDGYFELLRLQPILGRSFTPEELAIPGGSSVALLGEALWAERYGSDPAVLGKTIHLSAQPFTVIGVLPASFRGTSLQADLWLPLGDPALGIGEDDLDRGSRYLSVVARLAEGATLEEAQAEMDGIAANLEREYPDEHEDRIALVTPIRQAFMGSARTLVLLVLAATGLLLLIAGANVANLLLVRTTGRGNEVLMRKALGAGRMRLAGQFLTESMVLAGLGALAGLFIGIWGAQALAAAMPQALLPAYVEIRPDMGVFLMAAGLMTLVGLLAGLAPAVLAARSDLAAGLREGSQGSLGRRRTMIQRGLVVVEVALALLLMVGAGLMTRSFGAQLDIRPGFDHEALYAFRMTLPPEPYSGDALRAAMQEIEERLEAAPGVSAVTFGSSAPLRGGYSAAYLFVDGSSAEDRIRFYLQRVAPDWMETLGTRVVRGRALEMADLDNPEVTVISQALAERFFPGQDPVGQSIRVGRPDGLQLAIVGVAEDVRYRDLTTDLVAGADDPDIYLPWNRFATRTVDVVLRAAADPAALERTVRDVVAGFDPDLPVFQAQPMSQSLRNQTAQARFGTVLLGTFSGLAALLALVGLYGVLAFSVDQRRREIAVRMAIGAEAPRVRRMIVGQGMKLAAGGLVLGLGAAFLASRSLEAFLYGVEPVDLGTYATVSALMTMIGFLAAWLPARRATRVDPQRALNTE